MKEDDAYPANPDSFYGWEKLTTEKMCKAYSEDYGLETRISRFHNCYGPTADYGDKRGKVIACLIRKAIRYPKEPFVVWGDGKQERSFIYIDDLVDALLRLMESDYSEPLNIGTDRLISINDLAKMIIEISGKNITIEY
ncbi:MAG: NAD-dependent epimerase/dehydratase family protein, partial [Candidatus Korarchaeota archaeon]|nr:NAD-dependent epimerase/dehydratase family protein [Candidatus Korarchaeota archaeon]NIU84240.1 NAD-dependent epimerase/dehydratase family protein [Candidatus Thorarchaeota archaeon]